MGKNMMKSEQSIYKQLELKFYGLQIMKLRVI